MLRITKIVLGLLASLLLSSYFFVPQAIKIENIGCTREKIINLVHDRPDRNRYLEHKVTFFSNILDYCYYNRSELESLPERGLLTKTLNWHIIKNYFLDSIELNFIDNFALYRADSYSDLIYNVAVMYLSYRDLANPLDFTTCCRKIRELSTSYKTMELFHTESEIAQAKQETLSEQKKIDDIRVDELLDERIWFRGITIAPLFSDIHIPVCSRTCVNPEVLPSMPDRPATAPTFENTVVEMENPVSGIPERSFAGLAKSEHNTSDSDSDGPYPTPSDLVASLPRMCGVSWDSFDVPRKLPFPKRVPSMSEEARKRFGREMFQNKSTKDESTKE